MDAKSEFARLRILDVLAERLQTITSSDVRAEGYSALWEFSYVWDRINGRGSWDSNPIGSHWVSPFFTRRKHTTQTKYDWARGARWRLLRARNSNSVLDKHGNDVLHAFYKADGLYGQAL